MRAVLGFASLQVLLVAVVIVAIGALIQGCIGFGLALWSAPLLLLVDERLVPGPLIVATFVFILGSVWRERHAVELAGIGWVLAGRVPGTFAGAALLSALLPAVLSILLGGFVLLAVALSLFRGHFERTRPLLLVAGFVSGVMGTVAALGGPSVAVLYQHEHGSKFRATLAVIFAVGASMSLIAVAAIGRLGITEALLGFVLVPPVLIGLLVSTRLLRHLHPRRMRTLVLVVAALGGLLAIAQGYAGLH